MGGGVDEGSGVKGEGSSPASVPSVCSVCVHVHVYECVCVCVCVCVREREHVREQMRTNLQRHVCMHTLYA